MRNKVRAYIERNNLLSPIEPIIIGLSGGADSIALLSILSELGYCCIAAHCDFHLRGEESLRDEMFAMRFAESLNIPFEKIDFDTLTYAKEKQISIEMAARDLRYNWFEEIRKKHNAQAIAVAHHLDDSVETVLLNLFRGTGIKGLSGIQNKNNYIVRPFLCVTRQEILDWLKNKGLSYITDSTNLSDEYTRNFIRLRILPLLEEINPSVKDSIARTAQNLNSVRTIYENYIQRSVDSIFISENVISIDKLKLLIEPQSVLYEALIKYNFNRSVISDVYEALDKNSGRIFLSDTHKLIKDRDTIIIAALEDKEESYHFISEDVQKISYPIQLSLSKFVINKEVNLLKSLNTAYIDLAKVTFPLILRKWNKGDWFVPFGMKGKKKLSDYFTDRKFNLLKKEEIWLLCSGEDIVWIVGERLDNRYSIQESTKNMLVIKFSPL